MGCDIHLHTEAKINGKWEHFNAANMDRNYALFDYMAGVRPDGKTTAISSPRGLPSDPSLVTALDAKTWGGDGHSHSWLGAAEIVALEEWLRLNCDDMFPERQWGYLFGNSWGGFSRWPDERPKEVEDVRFVFWFDS
jgi:hypothetical protein